MEKQAVAAMPKTTSILKEALSHLSGEWRAVVLCTLAFIWIPFIPFLLDGLTHEVFVLDFWNPFTKSTFLPFELGILLLLIVFFIIYPMTFGYQCVFLKFIRKDTAAPSYSMLLVFKHRYGRWLLASLLFFVTISVISGLLSWILTKLLTPLVVNEVINIVIALTLILIVSLIAPLLLYYQYALMPYVVHDNQELSVWKCLMKSSKVLKGYRWKLFFIDLILYAPILVIQAVLSILLFKGIITQSIFLLCDIFLAIISLWITPWLMTSHAVLYSHITESQSAE